MGPSTVVEKLAGLRILVTGVTGFVGEALLERLLREVPTARPVVLVRARQGQAASERVARLLDKPAFRTLRRTATIDELLARIEVVEGDLAAMPELPGDLDIVIHCAGDVAFDPALDDGFTTNVVGVQTLLDAVRRAGSRPHYVHVSTAYVAGRRRGVVPETPVDHPVDWRAERVAATRMRDATEDASRAPARLQRFLREAEREHHRSGPMAVAADAERRRADWVRDAMVAAGRERARSLGWTDCYTMTKALAERMVEETSRDLPVSIVRPAIIESALRLPYPGWIEGFKMAEPVILAYGRGELPEFPGVPEGVIDIVPVDVVVGVLLAVAATPPAGAGTPAYFHVGSGARNPLTFRALYENVRSYFQDHPLEVRDRGAVRVPTWQFPGTRRVDGMLRRAERAAEAADRVASFLPRSERLREQLRSLDRQQAKLEFLRRYVDLYRPYADAELVFDDSNTVALLRTLHPDEVAALAMDVADVDWPHYLREVHCPSVTASLRRPRQRRTTTGAARPALPERADVLAVFDLEGTVVASNVIDTYVGLRVAELGRMSAVRELSSVALAAPGYAMADRRDRAVMLRSVYRRYAGASVSDLDRLVDEQFADVLLSRLHAAAVRRIRAHRAAGHRTVLVTGAVAPVTRPLTPLFDDIVAVDLDVRDGHYTGYLSSPPLVGESRAAWVRDLARRHGFDLPGSYAYADSASDAALLRVVGHPTAVNPDVALTRTARRHRWPIETWATGGRA